MFGVVGIFAYEWGQCFRCVRVLCVRLMAVCLVWRGSLCSVGGRVFGLYRFWVFGRWQGVRFGLVLVVRLEAGCSVWNYFWCSTGGSFVGVIIIIFFIIVSGNVFIVYPVLHNCVTITVIVTLSYS